MVLSEIDLINTFSFNEIQFRKTEKGKERLIVNNFFFRRGSKHARHVLWMCADRSCNSRIKSP